MKILSAFVMSCCLAGILPAQTVKQDAACVQALQTAFDRGETNLFGLTASCISQGQAASAQQALLALHDSATDIHVKLSLLRPMKWAALATGKLPEFEKLFATRRNAQPGSAFAWLEYAEAEGDSISYPAQAKSLTSAATLAWADEALLREILNRQEEAGFWDDALSTAEGWVKQHATPQARCRLAALNLIIGDDAGAWELAKEALKDPRLTAGDLQELARVACERHEWEPLAGLLNDALPKFPRHLGLLSLQAVALEEAGRDDEAAKAFLHLLGTRETLVTVPTVPSWDRSLTEIRSRDFSDQPPGTRDFALQEAWGPLAYAHRAVPDRFGWDRGPETVVHLPPAQDEARIFALQHLSKLNAGGDKKLAEEIKRASADLPHLDLHVEPNPDGKPIGFAELLKKNPDNEAVHAWWLGMWHGNLSSADIQVLQHCVEMFSDRYPVLAFTAARELAKSSSPEKERYQEQALTFFQRIGKPIPLFVMRTIYRLAEETKDWKNAAAWQDATLAVQAREARECPDEWDLPRNSIRYVFSRQEIIGGWLQTLRASQRWKEYAAALEEEARHQEPVEWIAQHYPGTSYGQGGPLLGKKGVLFPNILLRLPGTVTGTFGVFNDAKTRASIPNRSNEPWIGMLHDPRLKLLAQWCHGDAAEARAEITRWLAKPDATLADWWLGAWLAWEDGTQFPNEVAKQAAIRLSAERLAKAATFPLEGIPRSYLDAALLQAVLALRERPPALVAAAHEAARRFCAGTLASEYDGKDLAAAFWTLGFNSEAELVKKIPIVPHINEALNRIHGLVPASTLVCLRRSPPRRDDERAGTKALSADAKAREALRQLHQLRPDNGWQNLDNRLMERWKKDGIWEAVLAAAKPQDKATARELLRAGQDFELLLQPDTARQHYEAALRLSAGLDEARVRLVILALPERGEDALALLKDMKAENIGPLLETLSGRGTEKSGLINMVTRWLRHLTASRLALPTSCTIPIQSLMLYSRESAAELCRAALAFRELADIALGNIAEDALRKKRPLAEVAPLAKDLLKAQAAWSREPQRSTGSIDPPSQASPAYGFFTQPGVELILVWDAWQRRAPQEVESVILPLLRSAGKIDEEDLREGTALFFCAPGQFVEAAGRFVQNEQARYLFTGHAFTDRFFAGGTLDFITLVHRLRKLEVPLESLFLAEMAKPEAAGSSLAALATYIGLADHMTAPQARSFVRGLRDQLVDRDPERRKALIASTREADRYTPVPERWQRQSPATAGAVQYVSWLRKLLAEPRTCRAALEMTVEDGLLVGTSSHTFNLSSVFWEMDNYDAPHFVALLDGYSMLAPAQDFRTWATGADPSDSLLDEAADALNADRKMSKPSLELVKAIQPETFGSGLMLAWAAAEKAKDEAGRKEPLLRFMNAHKAEFKLIPAERWPEVGVFFRNLGVWSQPWRLAAEERVALAPLVEAQGRYLATFASRVMAVDQWEDMTLSGYEFIELSGGAFMNSAEADPATAADLAVKVIALLGKPSKYPGPRSVNTPPDPQVSWIYYATQTPAALAALRPTIERSDAMAGLSKERREKFIQVLDEVGKRYPK